MRTTVSIDDELLKRAKQEAVARGQTLGQVIEEALRERLTRQTTTPGQFRLRLVTAGGTGVLSGVDLADNAAVRDVLDGLG